MRRTIHGSLSVTRQILPDFSELNFSGSIILNACWQTIDLVDVGILFFFGWLTVPLGRLFYALFEQGKAKALEEEHGFEETPEDPYHASWTHLFVKLLSEITKIAALVYAFVCAVDVLQDVGFDLLPTQEQKDALTLRFGQHLYYIWFAMKLVAFKRYFLLLAARKAGRTRLGKAVVYDRILDVVIFAALAINIVASFDTFELGPGFQTLFAFGGVGTFVFGLASKDWASQVLSGLILTTSDKFHGGEAVQMGDTSGIVEESGWLYTDVRSGEVITRIPNNQLANQRVANLSRLTRSQVKQTLCFGYADIDKIENIVSDIKDEIQASCPKLITKGRPFRVHWRDFCEDYLEVVVDTRFAIKTVGNEYCDNRQQVLLAIARAAAKNGVSFDIPRYRVLDKDPS